MSPLDGTGAAISGDASPLQLCNPKVTCPLCGAARWLFQCRDLRTKNVSQRYQFVRENDLRYICLVPGHFVASCSKATFCRVIECEAKHSTLLHRDPERVSPGVESNNSATNAYLNVGDSPGVATGDESSHSASKSKSDRRRHFR